MRPAPGLVLEIHYSNDSDVAQQDASGVRFCTGSRSKRPHEAAVHTTGETRCFYENDTPDRAGFGEGTRDEMCYGFITAWPAGSLVSGGDNLSSVRSDLSDRCADPLSVLASCKGLADAL